MNTGAPYTFWKFIQENKIVIPVIQRDYAQGRKGKEELRKRFLTNLEEAIDSKNSGNPLILDFVYGMMRGNDRIVPLDGQQRLTTLWLLHWYAFLMSGKNVTDNNLPIFNNFTYETRSSSRYFIEDLCDKGNFTKLRKLCMKNSKPIREAIIDQTWFMKEWEQDPTVKAMLNMLGGDMCSIESKFNCSNWENVWEKLKNQECCPLRFYYLPIDGEIQQEPDDIYIKMNARGEHLTDFENFKADLIKFVRDDVDNKDDWKSAFDNKDKPELELSRLIDTEWTDVFWKNLSAEQKRIHKDKPLPNIDKQFFAFLNRYFVNIILIDGIITTDELKPQNRKKSNNPKIQLFDSLYEEKGESFKYKDFDIFKNAGVITPKIFEAFKKIMSNLKELDTNGIGINKTSIGIKWAEEENTKKEKFCFIPHYLEMDNENENATPDSITQIARIVFFGICCYLEFFDNPQSFDQDGFKDWMRYVWNIARNSNVQDIASMKNVMVHIRDTFNGVKDNILNNNKPYLTFQQIDDVIGYFERQKYEEWLKFTILNNDNGKIDIVHQAENAFHGSIRFLLPDLLESKYINKAKELLHSDEWIKELLPYLTGVFDNDDEKEIIFKNDENDIVKVINYSDVLVNAVQELLKNSNGKPTIDNNSWIYLLYSVPGLIDCSFTKKIGIKTIDGKKGIYQYKKSYWSENTDILLYSFDPDTQGKINARNMFIIDKIKDRFHIVSDEKDLVKDNLTDSANPHYGRAIIIKKGDTIYYCGVDNYWEGKNKKTYQETIR